MMNATHTIVAVGKSTVTVATATKIAPSVAPTSGIRSKKPDDETERQCVWHAEDRQDEPGRDRRQDADHYVAEDVVRNGVVDVDDQLSVALLARTGETEPEVHVLAAVEDQQERNRQHRDQLPDEAGGLHCDVLERSDQMPQRLGQASGVPAPASAVMW